MAVNEGLSEEERAELEQLRAEKAAREQAERDAAERAELDRLRAEKERADIANEAARAAQLAADREQARKLMEPDEDDLKMAPGQKIVIAAVVGIALVWLLITVIG